MGGTFSTQKVQNFFFPPETRTGKVTLRDLTQPMSSLRSIKCLCEKK